MSPTLRVKAGVIKRIFWATPPLHVPRDTQARLRHDSRDPRRLQHLASELGRISVQELIDRERTQGPEGMLTSIECHRCPWGATTACERAWRERDRTTERLAQRRAALEAVRGAYWQEFLRVVEVLEQFGAVHDRALTDKGRIVAGLRHDNELLLAEAVSRGVLNDLTLAEAAAMCSALTEESRSGEPNIARTFLRRKPKLRRRLEQLIEVAEAVFQAQRARHLGMPVSVRPGCMPSVFRWASGDDDWTGIVEQDFGGHEGDLIRAMRRLIDVLRQLSESPEVTPETAKLLGQAARLIDRGVVFESALI